MSGWFTIDTIDSDTFILSEYRHWEEPHCCLLCGTEREMVLDRCATAEDGLITEISGSGCKTTP